MALLLATLASGLFGTVVRSPTTPVCRVGMSCSAPAAHVTLAFVRGGLISRIRTDANGVYRIKLAPGTYTVRVTPTPSMGGRISPATVVVRRGATTRRNFSVDTGIR